MPAQIAFTKGLVQRAARHLYQDGELVDALNVTIDEAGALSTRPGHAVIDGPLDQLDVHSLYVNYDANAVQRRYAGAGTKLYRNASAIVTGLSGSRITFATLRGFGEQRLYTFAANGEPALRIKDDGTTLTQWGLNPPSVEPSVAGTTGSLSGTYRWRLTFRRKAIPVGLVYGTTTGADVAVETTGTSFRLTRTPLVTPSSVVATLESGGTLTDLTTYFYVVTARNDLGETLQSSEVSATTASPNRQIHVTWGAVTGATSYRVYRSLTTGVYTSPALLATTTSPAYVDTGTPGVATGTPPVANTSADNSGHIVAARTPFAELVYALSGGESGGSPVGTFAYWNGSTWTTFVPTQTPDFTTLGRQRLLMDFPATNWRTQTLFGAERYAIRYLENPASTVPAIADIIVAYDTVIAAESNPSPVSAELTLATQGATLTGIPDPSSAGVDEDQQVTHVAIYRTVRNQSLPLSPMLFEGEILAGETSFTSGIADTLLLDVLLYNNDRPPAFTAIAEHQQRIFGLAGNQVMVSKFEQPEAFPANFAFDVGTLSDPPTAIWRESGVLYVATVARIYQIVGFGEDAGGNLQYSPQETGMPTGLGAVASVVHGASGDYFLGGDGNFWRTRGPSQAQNISDSALYQLFHGVTLNGVLPLAQAQKRVCATGWFQSRVYFSYPTGAATVPNATLLFDEASQTWYRDSRGWRCFFYDRMANVLYGGRTDGTVMQVATGTTDNGSAITAVVQTRDEDEGVLDSEKRLTQLTVDAASATMSVSVVRDYDTTFLSLGTLVFGALRSEAILAGSEASTGLALGYRFTWTGTGHLYRLLPRVLIYPAWRKAYRTLPSDLGWHAPKRFEAFYLDVDVESGSLSIALYGDGLLAQTLTHSQPGRFQDNILLTEFDATIVDVRLSSTGRFRLYPNTTLGWSPLPPLRYTYRFVASDLGWTGVKIPMDLLLDLEWVEAGDITVTCFADGQPFFTFPYHQSEPRTRRRLPRERLPATPFRVLEVLMTAPGGFRLWPGTKLGWRGLGTQTGLQQLALGADSAQGQQQTSIQTPPLVSAAA